MYFNHHEDPAQDFICKATPLQIPKRIKKLETQTRYQYVLKPVNGRLRLTMLKLARNIDFSKPQFNADFAFEDFNFTVIDRQYKDFLSLIEYFTSFAKLAKFRKHRPIKKVVDDSAGWWRYACKFDESKITIHRYCHQ
jgi:hypothetical protein